MIISVIKEIKNNENRVGLTPAPDGRDVSHPVPQYKSHKSFLLM